MSVNISYKNTLQSYDVSPSMTIQDLIQEIKEKQNLPKILLKLGDVESLATCFVRKYILTTLDLCADDFKILVEINDITMDVRMVKMPSLQVLEDKAISGMTIGQFKQKISTKFRSSQGNWVLKKDGKAVRDADPLESLFNKKTFTVLELIQVIVSDNTLAKSVVTHADMTVAQFRIECSKKFGGMHIVSMSFGGQYLQDCSRDVPNRMGSYQIKDNDTIIVVAQVHGGHSKL